MEGAVTRKRTVTFPRRLCTRMLIMVGELPAKRELPCASSGLLSAARLPLLAEARWALRPRPAAGLPLSWTSRPYYAYSTGGNTAVTKARRHGKGTMAPIRRGRGWVHAGYASFEDYVTGEFAAREPFPIPYAVISNEAGEPLSVFEMAESIHAWGAARTTEPLLREPEE
jgi:hypothetical protein